jgi:hypothetical protein
MLCSRILSNTMPLTRARKLLAKPNKSPWFRLASSIDVGHDGLIGYHRQGWLVRTPLVPNHGYVLVMD